MNELALFAGAGGGILAGRLLGWRTVCAVERDEYAASVLAARQNDGILEPFPIWDDIRSFNGKGWRGIVDVVSGGFPCQAFSSAARGRNIATKDLWGEMYRVVQEVQPAYVFAENVAQKPINRAKDDLERIGFKSAYIKLSAKDMGADHIRNRYWLLAHSNHGGKLCGTEYAEAPFVRELRNGVWKTDPNQFRVVDGMAHRVDRLKALGNGQVPLVAAEAFLRLMQKLDLG